MRLDYISIIPCLGFIFFWQGLFVRQGLVIPHMQYNQVSGGGGSSTPGMMGYVELYLFIGFTPTIPVFLYLFNFSAKTFLSVKTRRIKILQ